LSRYVRNVIVKTSFDGDEVTVTLKPMTFADRLFIDQNVPEGALKDASREQRIAFATAARERCIPAVLSIQGLKDADGQALGAEVLGDAYFADLVSVVWQEWYRAASVADPKQPAGESSASSAG